jgi:hypothetical protein
MVPEKNLSLAKRNDDFRKESSFFYINGVGAI